MMYEVQTWNDTTKTVEYHLVRDAIDYEDAKHVVEQLKPCQNVIAVTRKG